MRKKNRGIFSSLVRNYIVFVVILIALLIVTALFTTWQLARGASNGNLPKIRAVDIVREDYEKINISDVAALEGWVEILDENRNIVYFKGDKRDNKQSYTQEEIFNLLSMDSNAKYYSFIQSFKAKDGRTYFCLIKYPQDKLNLTISFNNAPYSVGKLFYNTLIKAGILFLVLFITNVILYSQWTAKKIRDPLKKITEGIGKMSDGDLDARLQFKAEKEFALIRDTFNSLAEKLKASEIEKNKLEESKTRMLVDLSHDIKTPITTILGYSKALSDKLIDDEDKKQRYYKSIFTKASRVSELIDDLFEFVKLESTDYKLSKIKEDFVEFLRKIIAEYYEDIEENNFVLDLRIPDKEIMLNFDPKLMWRAISNIISNSIKYNAEGTKLRIEIIEVEGKVILEIADNGIGIPDHIKGRIFDAFIRVDESRKSDGGTGLGLAISRKIIELHGGELTLNDGNPGEKTRFTIIIALCDCL